MPQAARRIEFGTGHSGEGSETAGWYPRSLPVRAQLVGPAGVATWPIFALLVLLAVAVAAVWLIDPRHLPLPSCWFHKTTGLCCPGCGATRATHELLHGQVVSALRHNALWTLGLPLALYVAVSEILLLLGRRPLWGNPSRKSWFVCAVGALAVIFFLVRNIPVWPLVLLNPP